MQILTYGQISKEARENVSAEISDQENLKDMMVWALAQPAGTFLPNVVSSVIIQDEFTHDVIVPRSDGLVLVYDTT
jgi:hypothetical protein